MEEEAGTEDRVVLQSMFEAATFCIEELLVQRPHDPFLQTRYADLQFECGDKILAIKYYCFTLRDLQDYPRALYGLYQASLECLKQLRLGQHIQSKVPIISQDILQELNDLSKDRLKAMYGQDEIRDRGLETVVDRWLSSV